MSPLLGLGVPPCPWARASYSSWTLCWPFSSGLPCICQVVIALSWVFLALLSLMSASLTLIINHIARDGLMSSQAEPFYISFVAWFTIFYQERTFPRVSLSYTCFLALSIGTFHCLELVCLALDTHLLLVCNYKSLLLFFKISKYLKKLQKNQKNKNSDKKRCYIW